MIVVTGSLAFDYIFNFPGKFGDHIMPEKIHEINISFIVKRFEKRFGGTAGNIAYNLSLLGIKPAILACVGQDFGDYKKWLGKNNINTKYIKTVKNENSSTGFVMNDKTNNQIWGYSYGALRHGKNLNLKDVKEPIEMIIISANDPETFISFTNQAIELNFPYMYDFGMMLTAISKKDLCKGLLNAKILIGNDYEVSLMHKKAGLDKKKLLKRGSLIITTLGDKGSIIETKQEKVKVKAVKTANVVDPTGAGDAYRAGFLAGRQRGYDLKTCGKIGSVIASSAVEKYGTQEHKLAKKEFNKKYKKNFKKDIKL
ncbi:carbohydrate kinase family protein [Patescibacteria group bacterium]